MKLTVLYMQVKVIEGACRFFISYKFPTPNSAIHDFHMNVDSSYHDQEKLGVPAPVDHPVSIEGTPVFMSVMGDGFTEENTYQVVYEYGYAEVVEDNSEESEESGVHGLKPMFNLVFLLAAALLVLSLKWGWTQWGCDLPRKMSVWTTWTGHFGTRFSNWFQ